MSLRPASTVAGAALPREGGVDSTQAGSEPRQPGGVPGGGETSRAGAIDPGGRPARVSPLPGSPLQPGRAGGAAGTAGGGAFGVRGGGGRLPRELQGAVQPWEGRLQAGRLGG